MVCLKKLKGLLALLALLAVLIVIGASAVIGQVVHNRLPQTLERFNNQQKLLTATLSGSRQGWFSSWIEIEFLDAATGRPVATLSQQLKHGPLLGLFASPGLLRSEGTLVFGDQRADAAGFVSLGGSGRYTLSAPLWRPVKTLGIETARLELFFSKAGHAKNLRIHATADKILFADRAALEKPDLMLDLEGIDAAALGNPQPQGIDAAITALIAQGDAGASLTAKASVVQEGSPVELQLRLSTNPSASYIPGNLAALLFKIELEGSLKGTPEAVAALYELGTNKGDRLLQQAARLEQKGYLKPLEGGRKQLDVRAEKGNWSVGGRSVFQLMLDLR